VIVRINQTLLTLLGHARTDVEGGRLEAILQPGGKIFYQTHIFPLLKLAGRVDEIYLALRPKNGDEVPVLLNAVRRETEQGFIIDCVLIPVQQRYRFEEELLQARRAAELALLEKTKALEALHEARDTLQASQSLLEEQHIELEARQMRLLEANAKLEEDIVRRALREKYDKVLHSVVSAVRAASNTYDVQRIAIEIVGTAMNAERCVFLSVGATNAVVECQWHCSGLADIGSGNKAADVTHWINALLPDHQWSYINGPLLRGDSASRSMAVGAFDSNRLIGALVVSICDGDGQWTNAEIELLQRSVLQIRTGMDLARVRERERNIAQRLQAALLPNVPSKLPGLSLSVYYSSSLDEAEVGGDFYDVYSIGHERHVLVVADLSGKGLAAAAQIATVRHMLRAILYEHSHSIAAAVTKLNDIMAEHMLLSGFATAFIAIFHSASRRMEYVICAQESGVVRRAATGGLELLEPTGPILGSFLGVTFHSEVVQLNVGDTLAVFTDGLTEAGQSRRNMLGGEGVMEALRRSCEVSSDPNEITATMIDDVRSLVGDAGIRDDICLLVARVD
jgi:serine phosphatase RsbU (regulator of sigma subunit)